MAHKIAKWFVSETGKKVSLGLAFTTTTIICASYALPHTLLLDKYKDIVHLYKSGVPVPLTKSVMERYNKALDLLEIPEHERKILKPFSVFGFDIFNAGSLYSKFGGLVGIPLNFTYEDTKSIEKSDIMVNNEPVNWSSDAGQQLLNSLVLSENAQIFAIAREILYLKTAKLLFDTFFSTSVFVSMYGLGNTLNITYNLYSKPTMVRVIMYSLIGAFGFGLYSLFIDAIQNHYDTVVDQELCEKDPLFIQGGKEFYEKTILRNIALREIMGRIGQNKYSAKGNENFFLRQKRLPLVVRRDYFTTKITDNI